MIPTYIIFKTLGWTNSLAPLVLPTATASPFFVFLLRQFFLTIPMEMSEAAFIDGAGHLRIFWQVILPLTKPALLVTAIFTFVGAWNDFLGPLIYLNSTANYPLALGLRYFQQVPLGENPPREHLLMAAAIVMAAPCIALFFAAQRFFVQGITMSGLKG